MSSRCCEVIGSEKNARKVLLKEWVERLFGNDKIGDTFGNHKIVFSCSW